MNNECYYKKASEYNRAIEEVDEGITMADRRLWGGRQGDWMSH